MLLISDLDVIVSPAPGPGVMSPGSSAHLLVRVTIAGVW